MEDFGHDFVLVSSKDTNVYNYEKSLNDDTLYKCEICNLMAFKFYNEYNYLKNINDENFYYHGKGVDDSSIINISCEEYMIKKLLE
jgi:hypothetical protein